MKHTPFKHLSVYFRTYLKLILFFVIFSYLLINLFSSQFISPLYFQIIKDDKNAVIIFLHKIKNNPVFNSYLTMNKNIFGNRFEQEVFEEEQKRKESIAIFESALQKNPKSRDTLYNLYLLYKADNNGSKAEEYFNKAKEIDPIIKN